MKMFILIITYLIKITQCLTFHPCSGFPYSSFIPFLCPCYTNGRLGMNLDGGLTDGDLELILWNRNVCISTKMYFFFCMCRYNCKEDVNRITVLQNVNKTTGKISCTIRK